MSELPMRTYDEVVDQLLSLNDPNGELITCIEIGLIEKTRLILDTLHETIIDIYPEYKELVGTIDTRDWQSFYMQVIACMWDDGKIYLNSDDDKWTVHFATSDKITIWFGIFDLLGCPTMNYELKNRYEDVWDCSLIYRECH